MSAAGTFNLPQIQVKKLFTQIAFQTGQSTVALLNDVMKLWAKDLIKNTYPKSSVQGRKRVDADIHKLFSSIKDFDNENITRSFKSGNEWDLESKAGTLLFRPAMREAEILHAHQSARDSRGRVKRQHSRTIVRRADLNRVIRKAKAKVGRLKAGWSAAALRYGIKLPGWVAKNVSFESGFTDTLKPSTLSGHLIAENRVPYAARKLSQGFMDMLLRKRVRDLTQGTYAKRWQKRMEKATRVRSAA